MSAGGGLSLVWCEKHSSHNFEPPQNPLLAYGSGPSEYKVWQVPG